MFFSFEIGDFLLHEQYGVGRLIALESISIAGNETEFLKLEYANSSFVFIPVFRINVLKLHSKKDAKTEVDLLGKSKIFQKRAKVKAEIAGVAKELAKIAAAREKLHVEPIIMHETYKNFVQTMPFELTIWQNRAIEDIFNDMAKTKPMDRLLCADVGFGKTEVALHAIFLAVANKKKALFLVPTTILAHQHYQSAKERLHGMRIGCLNRATQEKDVLQHWQNGELDILISTASNKGIEKLLRDDIGLIVLDEEHHFGAEFKEKVRNIGHFLQLSATPIPRTLSFALAGIKDISLLEMPPMHKQDIDINLASQSEIREQLENLVHEEIHKNGRVFLVVPRVSMIPDIERILATFEKKEKYVVLHGQLPSQKITQNLDDFSSGKAQILIGTTIIESGLNIVQANLIVIFSAHMFGIAQLHQLKGRVGRSDQKAAVYFVVPECISEITLQRFEVLQSHAHVGANYSLAIEDMNLRGAGAAFGKKQWGSDYGFGVEAYYDMISQALHENVVSDEMIKQTIEFDGFGAAFIPKDFIEDEYIRLNFYKKLGDISKFETFQQIKEELLTFGQMPVELENFIYLMQLQFYANIFNNSNSKLRKISKVKDGFELFFAQFDADLLQKLAPLKPSIKKKETTIIVQLTCTDLLAAFEEII